jgi:hypothetical protein
MPNPIENWEMKHIGMHDQLMRQDPPFATMWKPLPQESINYDLWTHKDIEEYGYEHESKNTNHTTG